MSILLDWYDELEDEYDSEEENSDYEDEDYEEEDAEQALLLF